VQSRGSTSKEAKARNTEIRFWCRSDEIIDTQKSGRWERGGWVGGSCIPCLISAKGNSLSTEKSGCGWNRWGGEKKIRTRDRQPFTGGGPCQLWWASVWCIPEIRGAGGIQRGRHPEGEKMGLFLPLFNLVRGPSRKRRVQFRMSGGWSWGKGGKRNRRKRGAGAFFYEG